MPSTLVTDILDAFAELDGGIHHGFRPVHAKGFMYSGTFTPSPEAVKLTRAPTLIVHPLRSPCGFRVRQEFQPDPTQTRSAQPARDCGPVSPGRPRPHRYHWTFNQRLPGPDG